MKIVDTTDEDKKLDLYSNGGVLDFQEAKDKTFVPLNRGVDKSFAVIVTFVPPIAFILGIWLHIKGIHRITGFDILLTIVMFCICLTGIELGYHRLFSHRSYKAKNSVAVVLAAMGSMAFQGPVIWWASVHRRHHRNSDQKGDPHSMYLFGNGFLARFRGFIHAHLGWIWTSSSVRYPDWSKYVIDLYKISGIFKVHMNYIFWMIAGFAIPGIMGSLYYGLTSNYWIEGFLLGVLWGGAIRIFFMNHLSFWCINTITHGLGGYRVYKTKDYSTNSLILAIPTFGQSLHNNHHAFPYSSVMGHKWWEIDIGTWILKLLSKFDLVWDLKKPSKELMKRKKISNQNKFNKHGNSNA